MPNSNPNPEQLLPSARPHTNIEQHAAWSARIEDNRVVLKIGKHVELNLTRLQAHRLGAELSARADELK